MFQGTNKRQSTKVARKSGNRVHLRIEALEQRVLKDAAMSDELLGCVAAQGNSMDDVVQTAPIHSDGQNVVSESELSELSSPSADGLCDQESLYNWAALTFELPQGQESAAEIVGDDLSWAALNPQPLPPREFEVSDFVDDLDAMALYWEALPSVDLGEESSVFDDLDWAALNPQPLPPLKAVDGAFDVLSELDWATLNPQPLPPREGEAVLGDELGWAMLNPQPLPPKEQYVRIEAAAYPNHTDWVALNPQPLPPRDYAFIGAVTKMWRMF